MLQNTKSIYKNQLYFYMLATNNLKMKLSKQFYLQQHQRLKMEQKLLKIQLKKTNEIHIHGLEDLILLKW